MLGDFNMNDYVYSLPECSLFTLELIQVYKTSDTSTQQMYLSAYT